MRNHRGRWRLLMATLVGAPLMAAAMEVSHAALRDELLRMRDAEQTLRKQSPIDLDRLREVDLANQARFKQLIGRDGIPTLAMVGDDGVQAAWLIVQHADNDPELQRSYLAGITQLAEQGQYPFSHVAYLHDRLHRPQRYGTQGGCDAEGRWAPREIEEPAGLDDRRAKAGLPPMAQYVERASRFLCRKPS